MDNFGSWLVETLEVREITQSDLARMSGLSRGTISNIISGSRGRGPDSLRAIAKALRLPPEQIYRAAGILPQVPDVDEETEKIVYEAQDLTNQEADGFSQLPAWC